MTFAKLIKDERAKHNLNRKHFAEKVGVGKSTVASWESGSKQPTVRSIMRISKHLGWTDKKTLDIIYKREKIQEVDDIKQLVWQASLRMGQLGYQDYALASLVGAHYKTILNWKTGNSKPSANTSHVFVARLEELLGWSDAEIEENLKNPKEVVATREEAMPVKIRRRTKKERAELHKERKRVLEKYNNLGIEFREMTDEQLAEVQEVYGVI